MTQIAHIAPACGVIATGTYRLLSSRIAVDSLQHGENQFTIADSTGIARCSLSPSCVVNASELDGRTRFVQISGWVAGQRNGTLHINATRIVAVSKPDRPSWHLLSRSWVPPIAPTRKKYHAAY